MAGPRRTRSNSTKDVMETFKAMARAVREQAPTTTFMAQQMANNNDNGNGNGHGHGNGHGEVDYEYMKFAKFPKVNLPSF